jgi:hypothetical protein
VRYLRTPGRVYVVGFVSLALICTGAVLSSNERHPALAIALSAIGAVGMLACGRAKDRQESKDD